MAAILLPSKTIALWANRAKLTTRRLAAVSRAGGMFGLPTTATAPFCPSEVRGTVSVAAGLPLWKKVMRFAGPGLLISVGYMDPGNWATDIEAGSRFGNALLFVVGLSSLAGIILQTLCARLGIVAERDLARLCRDEYKRPVALMLWLFAEGAIVACDIAGVLGSGLALQLVFNLPVLSGWVCTEAVTDSDEPYHLLDPLAGAGAAVIFGFALLASGQSSTFTGTLAGQVIMDGFLDLKIPCWQRRVITRGLALIPALIGVLWFGEGSVGRLLVLTQVVLTLQLPFALYPLIRFTGNTRLMGSFANGPILRLVAWAIFVIIVGANLALLRQLAS